MTRRLSIQQLQKKTPSLSIELASKAALQRKQNSAQY
jgi:hypothetical protein